MWKFEQPIPRPPRSNVSWRGCLVAVVFLAHPGVAAPGITPDSIWSLFCSFLWGGGVRIAWC